MDKFSMIIFVVLFQLNALVLALPTTKEAEPTGNCSKKIERQDRETGLCHVILSPCNNATNQIFYNDKDGFGKCECNYTSFVRHKEDNQCYRISTQGPCQDGEWIPPTDFGLFLSCQPNPCIAEQEKDKFANDDNFWFSSNGTCWKRGTQGYCSKDHFITYKYYGAEVFGKKVIGRNLPSRVGFDCLTGEGGRSPMGGEITRAGSACGINGSQCPVRVGSSRPT